ncbi:MAG: stalk domain-containing protein, partial [Clostridium sp.]
MIKKILILLLILTLMLVVTSCKNPKIDEPPIVVKPDHIVVNYDDFEDLSLQKDTPKLFINGSEIAFKLPIYIDKNRYLLSLNEIMDTLGGKIKRNEENGSLDISIFDKTYNIDLTTKLITIDNKNIKLKKDLLVQNDFYYISLIDLSNMFNMYTYWDRNTNSIYCSTDDTSFKDVAKYVPKV